jgi:hypothetical protein
MADELDKPMEYRYPTDERPRLKPMESEAFDPPTDHWANYGDYHPTSHGGLFVQFNEDRGKWECVQISPPEHFMDGVLRVLSYTVEPSDVWDDPDDPLTDFTDTMKRVLRSLGDEHQLPNVPPFLKRVTYYAADVELQPGDMGDDIRDDDRPEDLAEWWDLVESYGVDRTRVSGIADSELPDGIEAYDPDG